jgi:pimeloyl-ACP methyl ester carboxylesterase
MPSKYVTYKGINVHYEISGKGLTVLLLHGFGETQQIWQEQKQILQDRFTVITPDIPGSGKSSAFTHSVVTMDDYAHVIRKIKEVEKIDQLVVIGHSMGGYIALAYLALFPADLIGIGLFQSTAYADNAEKKIVRKKAIDFIEKNGGESFLKTSLPGLFYQPNSHLVSIRKILNDAETIDKNTLIQYYRAMMDRPDRTQLLKDTGIPIIFIAGLHDQATPCMHAVKQSILPYLSEIHILKAAGHMGMLEEPATAAEILSKFLDGLAGRSGQAFLF